MAFGILASITPPYDCVDAGGRARHKQLPSRFSYVIGAPNRMVKKVFLTFFTSLQRKRAMKMKWRCTPSIKQLRARWMPVHPCTGNRLAKNGVFHQPANPFQRQKGKRQDRLPLRHSCSLCFSWLSFDQIAAIQPECILEPQSTPRYWDKSTFIFVSFVVIPCSGETVPYQAACHAAAMTGSISAAM